MHYVSTRGGAAPQSFTAILLEGLAPGGGLYLPEAFPKLSASELASMRGMGYRELAFAILSRFADDVPGPDLRAVLDRSYTAKSFGSDEITPVRTLEPGLHLLGLSNGPSLAFKDVALQFLGNVFEYILSKRGTSLNILGSTSGDTGSAAIAGVRGKDAISIFVMYPDGRTSRLQELQMTSILDPNVHCIAIQGSFDECQAIMKDVFNDLPFKTEHSLGAVNSVNWARLLAQIVYYVYATLALDDGGRKRVSFSVPTGNFGDIFAGYLALQMGLPIERLICATNENDILSVFFNTGVYRRGQVHRTISPSMDIQVASNFERFLYLRMGRDSERLRAFMESFGRRGEATLEGEQPVDRHISATAIDTRQTMATIADVYRDNAYIVDPHTAVGIAAARQMRVDGPVVCLATAHPAKFPESVDAAIGKPVAKHPRLDALEGVPNRRTVMPARVADVKAFVAAHAR